MRSLVATLALLLSGFLSTSLFVMSAPQALWVGGGEGARRILRAAFLLCVLALPSEGLSADREYYFKRGGQNQTFSSLSAAIAAVKSGPVPSEDLEPLDSEWGIVDEYKGEMRWTMHVPSKSPVRAAGEIYYRGGASYRLSEEDAFADGLREDMFLSDVIVCGRGKLVNWIDSEYVFSTYRYRPIRYAPGIYLYELENKKYLYEGPSIPYDPPGLGCSSPEAKKITIEKHLKKYTPIKCEDGYFFHDPGYSEDRKKACHNNSKVYIYSSFDDGCEPQAGNPCGVLSGKKKQKELDFEFAGTSFVRNYTANGVRSWKEVVRAAAHHSGWAGAIHFPLQSSVHGNTGISSGRMEPY